MFINCSVPIEDKFEFSILTTELAIPNIDHFCLANAMRSVHSLEVFLRIPVVFNENDRVCAGQIQAQAANLSGQQQNVNRGI
ncbi:hypothetical protein BpHYR1_035676 [Brachionus plicatilis]|uniref:Uncharacterized protein n=1 Tax=Brachionus plicatilis TaxID=10195 RepID=A0A3M7QMD0_BRAPC|nr:hypothetical protein BpHYR1_035676 [Brachionus plicatilis]